MVSNICPIFFIYSLSLLIRSFTAPNPNQNVNINHDGYERFVTHIHSLVRHCQRHFATRDPLLIEDTIIRIEGTIRTIRVVIDSVQPPISQETQDVLAAVITQLKGILSEWRHLARHHQQLGE